MTNLESLLRTETSLCQQRSGFSSGHVWMWELDYKESWAPKNWCFWTVVLEETLECPLDCKEIQPVHPKGDQSWVFTGRTGAEAEAPVLSPPVVKNWLIGKDPDAGKDWWQKKRAAEDEMVGWHHRLNGHEFEQTPGDSEGQGGLWCCSPWGHKESDTTEQKQNDLMLLLFCRNIIKLVFSEYSIQQRTNTQYFHVYSEHFPK